MNMKNIFSKILVFGAASLLLAACEMNLNPTTAIVYDENEAVIQKASDLTAFESNILANFRGTQGGFYYLLSDVMCDAFNAAEGYGNNYGPIHRTNKDFTASDQDVEAFWGNYYIVIKNYNIAINAANTIENAELRNEAKIMKGEAFLFRAYTYLQLARHFGKDYDPATAATDLCVPLVTVYDQAARPSRASVQEIYDQIGKDLDSAAVLLAGVPGAPLAQKPTIDLVKAMQARYYLDIENYTKAAELAQGLIDSGLYPLATTKAGLEDVYVKDKGTEAIVQMYASKDESPNTLDAYTGFGSVAGVGNVFRPYFLPSKKLVDSYEASDFRGQLWLTNTTGTKLYINAAAHGYADLYVFVKYFGNGQYTANGLPNGGTAIKPVKMDEIYLIAAEAYLKAGDNAKAKTALNALQTSRGATATVASEATIQDEWFKETVGDGLRMSCLKRWGVGFADRAAQPTALTNKLVVTGDYFELKKADPKTDHYFQWPVPSYEIQVNSNLEQNPGYAANATE